MEVFIKIRKSLKKEHNIEISHQSIENIILNSEYEIKHEIGLFQDIIYLMLFGLKRMEIGSIF